MRVPAPAVKRLLGERPKAKGIAVAGMPAGSPGMEGGRPATYTVMLIDANGHRPFMHFTSLQPVS